MARICGLARAAEQESDRSWMESAGGVSEPTVAGFPVRATGGQEEGDGRGLRRCWRCVERGIG